MVPHPNMRILSGPDHAQLQHLQQTAQARQDSQTQLPPFQFNYEVQHPQSPQSFFLPSYDPAPPTQQPSLSASHHFDPSNSRSHALNAQLPPLQVNGSSNFMLTCPLVHCGFQSHNLIDLWKHVTWDHVGLTPLPSHIGPHGNSSSSRNNFDMGLSPDFGAGGPGPLKVDPGMMDYLERIVLDVDPQQQHQHHDKRGELDHNGIGYPLGLQLDDLDTVAASMGVCGRAVNVSSA